LIFKCQNDRHGLKLNSWGEIGKTKNSRAEMPTEGLEKEALICAQHTVDMGKLAAIAPHTSITIRLGAVQSGVLSALHYKARSENLRRWVWQTISREWGRGK